MRVIARSTLNKFVETLSGTKQRFAVKAALDAWFHEANRADWRTPADVKANYATASIVDGQWNVLRVAAEPGGAAALAALLVRRYQSKPGERFGVLVCGGNTSTAAS